MTRPTTWGHWKNPVIYMSRATTREVWRLLYGTEPDLKGDLRYGKSQIPVLFDDRMELGTARLEEDPSGSDSCVADVEEAHGEALMDDLYHDWPGEPGDQCASVELIWGTRCGKTPGHERAESPVERLHEGRRDERETLRWGEPEDIRQADEEAAGR